MDQINPWADDQEGIYMQKANDVDETGCALEMGCAAVLVGSE